MKLRDLEVFDIIKTKNGDVKIILPNKLSENGLGIYFSGAPGICDYLSSYNEDLTHGTDSIKDIIAVRKCNNNHWEQLKIVFQGFIFFEWTWVKDPLNLTIKEIEKITGVKVEVIE